MKMEEKLDTVMFAPCGFNCALCIKHISGSNPCPGCLIDSKNKAKSALKCKIKACLETQRVKITGSMKGDYHDKNNQKRNQFSTLENAKRIQNTGINKIMAQDAEEWRCDCGGVISIQKRVCSECQKPKEDGSIN